MTDPTEHQIQCAVIDWRDTMGHLHPALCRLHAIPNGGKRDKAVAGKLKAEGVTPGVPDLCLPFSVQRGFGRYFGLYIEVKTMTGRMTVVQQEWLAYLRKIGYKAELCRGVDETIAEICDYLEIDRGY